MIIIILMIDFKYLSINLNNLRLNCINLNNFNKSNNLITILFNNKTQLYKIKSIMIKFNKVIFNKIIQMKIIKIKLF